MLIRRNSHKIRKHLLSLGVLDSRDTLHSQLLIYEFQAQAANPANLANLAYQRLINGRPAVGGPSPISGPSVISSLLNY